MLTLDVQEHTVTMDVQEHTVTLDVQEHVRHWLAQHTQQ